MLPKREHAQRCMLHIACLCTAQALGEKEALVKAHGSLASNKHTHCSACPALKPLNRSQMQGMTNFIYQSIHKGVAQIWWHA